MKLSGSVLREQRHTPSEGFFGEQTCCVLHIFLLAAEAVPESCCYMCCTSCRFSDFLDEIWSLYDNEDTAGHAMSTGWKEVDQFYRV